MKLLFELDMQKDNHHEWAIPSNQGDEVQMESLILFHRIQHFYQASEEWIYIYIYIDRYM